MSRKLPKIIGNPPGNSVARHAEATILLGPEDFRPIISAEDGLDEVRVGLIVSAEARCTTGGVRGKQPKN